MLVMAVFAGWAWLREPAYNGTSASQWLDSFERTSGFGEEEDPALKARAVAAFQAMGKSGVKFLGETMVRKPSHEPGFIERKMEDPAFDKWVPTFIKTAFLAKERNEKRQENAYVILNEMGLEAAPALPILMQNFNKAVQADASEIPWDTYKILKNLGDKKAAYMPDFVRCLTNESEMIACDGAYLLASIGPPAHAALPVLLEQFHAGDWAFSNAVAMALWQIDRQTNTVLQIFLAELTFTNQQPRMSALNSLEKMGDAARPAVELIKKSLLRARNIEERRCAEEALEKIDPAALQEEQEKINRDPDQFENLKATLINSINFKKFAALSAIELYGPKASPAIPSLIDIITNNYFSGVRAQAISVLAETGPQISGNIPYLTHSLAATRYEFDVTLEACRALGISGSNAISALPDLEKLLLSKTNSAFKITLAAAITRISPQNCSNAISLLQGVGDGVSVSTNQSVYWIRREKIMAQIALWRLGLEKELPLNEMLQTLNKHYLFESDIELVGDVGPAAKEAVPLLEIIIRTNQTNVYRRKAAIALRKIDPVRADELRLPGLLLLPD